MRPILRLVAALLRTQSLNGDRLRCLLDQRHPRLRRSRSAVLLRLVATALEVAAVAVEAEAKGALTFCLQSAVARR